MPTGRKNIYQINFADRINGLESSIIRDVFGKLKNPDLISFAGGAPDTQTLPGNLLTELNEKALNKYGNSILQYGQTEGFLPLRKAIVDQFSSRLGHVSENEIFISSGAQSVLHLVAMALINPNDSIGVENPTFLGALKTFQAFQPNFVPIDSDHEGVVIDSLEKKLKQTNLKFLYIIPTFQNPTGNSMTLQRKRELAEFIIKENLIVIEDDPYYDLRYVGINIPTLYSLAPNNVIYVGSLSKIFSPAMRLGFFVASEEISKMLVILKQGIDLHASIYTQALAAEYFELGYFKHHLKKMKHLYGSRLQKMDETLKLSLDTEFDWKKPEGGMFLWLKSKKHRDTFKLFTKATNHGVSFIPGKPFFVGEKLDSYLRLNFTGISENMIMLGIKKLSGIYYER